MANSLSFNSVDLGDGIGGVYNVLLVNPEDIWMPEPTIDTQLVPQGPGVNQGVNFGRRVMPMTLDVEGSNVTDLKAKLDAFVLLTNVVSDKKIQLDHITDRYWMGRLSSGIVTPPAGYTSYQFPARFLSVRPGYSTTEVDDDFSIVTDPDTFNVNTGGAVAGTDEGRPIWYIRNETGGAVTSLSLENVTRSETLSWTGSLANGYWLKIDTENHIIEKSTSSGADPTALSYNTSIAGWVNGSDWPALTPGVQNAMSLTGIDTGTVQWIYRARYV